jgi:DNA-binding YbaB/EbfC family protein
MAFNQVKMLNDLRKAQKELAKEIIEVEAGDGAVVVQINGELKIKNVKIDPALVDLNNISELEHWIEIAVRDGLAKAQEVAAEKMKPLMGGLGNLGL